MKEVGSVGEMMAGKFSISALADGDVRKDLVEYLGM